MTAPAPNRWRIALIVVLAIAVAYLALWRPRAGQMAELQQERDELSQELAGLAQAEASPPPSTGSSSEVLAAAIPPTDDLANLLRQFQEIAAATGVEQRNVATARPSAVTGAAGASIPITITVAGPRAAALDYVRRLGVLPRMVVVDTVTVEPGGEAADSEAPAGAAADRVQLDISGRVFTTATPATEVTDG